MLWVICGAPDVTLRGRSAKGGIVVVVINYGRRSVEDGVVGGRIPVVWRWVIVDSRGREDGGGGAGKGLTVLTCAGLRRFSSSSARSTSCSSRGFCSLLFFRFCAADSFVMPMTNDTSRRKNATERGCASRDAVDAGSRRRCGPRVNGGWGSVSRVERKKKPEKSASSR